MQENFSGYEAPSFARAARYDFASNTNQRRTSELYQELTAIAREVERCRASI